jgi:hypothetical protein
MEQSLAKCIKCGADKVEAEECPNCGVIYAKAEKIFFDNIKNEVREKENERLAKEKENRVKDSAKTEEQEVRVEKEKVDAEERRYSRKTTVSTILAFALLIFFVSGGIGYVIQGIGYVIQKRTLGIAISAIKEEMNNPASFELIKADEVQLGDGQTSVMVYYRGENAFGATIKNEAIVFLQDGKITHIVTPNGSIEY